jgi:sterol desaturase/sphingolipid hydroxylase (fatty acid hydroxylase superfamily)
MYHSPIFKHDSFEPVLSSTMFLVYITGWMLVDFYIPSLQRFRIQAASDNRAWKGREEAAYKEAAWYLLPLLVIDYFFPRRQLPSDAPTIGRIATEVVLGLVLYDAFFFLGHFCLHKSKYLMQKVHGKHHKNYSVRAPDAIHHTFIDGTWDVLCSVIALNVLRAHPMSRAIYNMVAIYLITEAHCGIEFPWMPHRVVPFHIVAGPVVHDRHHRNGSVNYQKFFTHLDYLAGTLQLNDPEMPTGEDGAKQQ